jgi:hypothetical protein
LEIDRRGKEGGQRGEEGKEGGKREGGGRGEGEFELGAPTCYCGLQSLEIDKRGVEFPPAFTVG